MTDALHALAEAYGVDTRYTDWQGQECTVSTASLVAVLAAFGVDAGDPDACRAALQQRSGTGAPALPPTVVLRSGAGCAVADPTIDSTSDPSSGPGSVPVLRLEDGTERALQVGPDGIELPADLPLGYHRMRVPGGAESHVIVVPESLRRPLDTPGWGLAVQLYSVRSRGSWGVGDLRDLRDLAAWSATDHGADFLLVNPLHAAEVVPPMTASPYLPTSRRFSNPLYLRIEDAPEYDDLDARRRSAVDALGEQVRSAPTRTGSADLLPGPDGLIDRDAAWVAKLAALELLFAEPLRPERADAFAAYRAREGSTLDRFATWCAITEVHGADLHTWPAGLRHPDGADVAEFAAGHTSRIELFSLLQWLVDEQLAAAQDGGRRAGMRLGILHDVAVGVSPDGADAWAYQDALALGVRVGAPPDAYSQLGQDWQQPPWRPDRLAELGYAPLRDLFRTMVRHAGGLRVDHIIGLFRLWWIPEGMEPLDGTYVHYDHDALIGVLMLEAQRAGAVVIGEDLGNVEPWVRDYLHERGLLGTSILWFESDGDAPLPAARWRELCLASVTTHDLPPTAGYLAGDHVRLRDRLELLTRSVDEELADAERQRTAWVSELQRAGVLARDGDDTAVLVALHDYLRRTPSLLRCVALTDVVGERRTQNQPGTDAEYPNWRVPLADHAGRPVLLDDVLANRLDDLAVAVLAGIGGAGSD